MLVTSRADLLRLALLGALGASFVASCGGVAETKPGGGDGDGDGDDSSGDGDRVVPPLPPGDGDGDFFGDGDGDGVVLPVCSNPIDLGGGFYHCSEGYTHRTGVGQCPTSVPRMEQIGNPEVCSTEQGCCMTDADCTMHNQYCQSSSFEPGTWCSIGCLSDADCGEGAICQCGEPMGMCVSAVCKSDEDCPGAALCASFVLNNGCGPTIQFTCQTSKDECASSIDCGEGEECDGSSGVRKCMPQQFTCQVGRPFLVGEEIRVAPLCERLEWVVTEEPERTDLSEEERTGLAVAWEVAAQMEHASIAAFARFALQLLSLGAPPELIERTNQALVDETRHARLCFGLASSYRGYPVGPAPLDMTGVMASASLEVILATTIIEGCCGETVAALLAAEAAAHCEDLTVKAILEQISQDELRHAELAFRFVRWALAEHPGIRSLISAQFAHILDEAGAGGAGEASRATEPGPLAAYGVFSEDHCASLRCTALREVVAPCARELLAGAGTETPSPTKGFVGLSARPA